MGDDIGIEPTTWLETKREKVKEELTGVRLKDCVECRFIGGTGMILAGCYVGYVGQRRVVLRGGGALARLPSALVAGMMLSLGVMRLTARNPFSGEGSEVGIDLLHRLFPKEPDKPSRAA